MHRTAQTSMLLYFTPFSTNFSKFHSFFTYSPLFSPHSLQIFISIICHTFRNKIYTYSRRFAWSKRVPCKMHTTRTLIHTLIHCCFLSREFAIFLVDRKLFIFFSELQVFFSHHWQRTSRGHYIRWFRSAEKQEKSTKVTQKITKAHQSLQHKKLLSKIESHDKKSVSYLKVHE